MQVRTCAEYCEKIIPKVILQESPKSKNGVSDFPPKLNPESLVTKQDVQLTPATFCSIAILYDNFLQFVWKMKGCLEFHFQR